MRLGLAVFAIGGCMSLISCGLSLSSLPACNSQEVVPKVNQLLGKSLLSLTGAIKTTNVQSPAEMRYDVQSDIRVCHAIIETVFGSKRIVFTVEWHDKANNIFWVELIGQNSFPLVIN